MTIPLREVTEVPFVEVELVTKTTLPVKDRAEMAGLLRDWGLARKASEEVWVVALDGDCNVRSVTCVARGGYHDVYVSVPTIFSAALISGCDRFLVAHNHPSGKVDPSPRDIEITRQLKVASKSLDMLIDDHLILAPNGHWLSMRARGHL